MLSKYKPGDWVQVQGYKWYKRNRDSKGDVTEVGSPVTFRQEMSSWCGCIGTVAAVHDDGCELDGLPGLRWDDWMLQQVKHIVPPKSPRAEEPEEVTQEAVFNVGDTVRIKDRAWYDAHKTDMGWLDMGQPKDKPRHLAPNQLEYLGTTQAVSALVPEGKDIWYQLSGTDDWKWYSWAMDLVLKEQEGPQEAQDSQIEPALKVGDKVRIKSREWYEARKNKQGGIHADPERGEYGGGYFFAGMQQGLGTIQEIARVRIVEGCPEYRLKGGWILDWYSWMFEPGTQEEHDSEGTPVFQAGDRVRVKDKNVYAECLTRYGCLWPRGADIAGLLGTEQTIGRVVDDSDGTFYYKMRGVVPEAYLPGRMLERA
jgi:hypothetical protein